MASQDKPKLNPVIHERPKMPARTWSALRSHIITERKKKQEEEGKLEEEERMKTEREHKKKQEANNLEETKDQISMLEEKLSSLKDEKHQLFLTLKKVLNEDDVRRRKESSEMAMLYPQHQTVFPMTGHVAPSSNTSLSSRYMQPVHHQSRQAVYMKPGGQNLPPVPVAQPVKRNRTPSPPLGSVVQPQAFYQTPQLTTSQARVVSSVYGAPSPSYSMSNSYHFSPITTMAGGGGRDLLREAVSQGLGPGTRDILQAMGARERELLSKMSQRDKELLASLGGQGRELLAGLGGIDRGVVGGSRDLLSQNIAVSSAAAAKESDTYARYLASFQQQIEAAGSKAAISELDRAKAMTIQGELERARMSISLNQAQPTSLSMSLAKSIGGGYYTSGSGAPQEQPDRGVAGPGGVGYRGPYQGRYYVEPGKK